MVAAAPAIAERLGALVSAAEPYLRGAVRAPAPAPRSAKRFVHGDICPDHVIVDPVTGELHGLIDFADAMVGDPVLDFVGLVPLGGAGFVADVVSHYPHPLDDGFWDRLAWLSRTLTLRWLADAIAEGGDVAKHVRWVERAFAGGAAGSELR